MRGQFQTPFSLLVLLTVLIEPILTEVIIDDQPTLDILQICYYEQDLIIFDLSKSCSTYDNRLISPNNIGKSSSADLYFYSPKPGSKEYDLDCDNWNDDHLLNLKEDSSFTITDLAFHLHCSSAKVKRLMSDGSVMNSIGNYWEFFETFSAITLIMLIIAYTSWCCLSFWMIGWLCKRICLCVTWCCRKIKSKLPHKTDSASIVEMMKKDPDFMRMLNISKSAKSF